jgi:hypothetical protein
MMRDEIAFPGQQVICPTDHLCVARKNANEISASLRTCY